MHEEREKLFIEEYIKLVRKHNCFIAPSCDDDGKLDGKVFTFVADSEEYLDVESIDTYISSL